MQLQTMRLPYRLLAQNRFLQLALDLDTYQQSLEDRAFRMVRHSLPINIWLKGYEMLEQYADRMVCLHILKKASFFHSSADFFLPLICILLSYFLQITFSLFLMP